MKVIMLLIIFEVGGHWRLWRGWKNEWPQLNAQKPKPVSNIDLKLNLSQCLLALHLIWNWY